MKTLLRILLRTENEPAYMLLRLMLGVVMFAHGAQKLFGWFGGYGFSGTMNHFTESMGIPAVFAFLAIMAESVGALALVLGLFTRVAALGIGVNMTVAIVMVHLKNGFFMNWSGKQGGEGYEFHLLVLAIVIVLLAKGAGFLSLDGWLARGPLRARPDTNPRAKQAGEPALSPPHGGNVSVPDHQPL